VLIGKRILVVDDEEVLARNLDRYFSKRLAEVLLASSGEAAVAVAPGFAPDVVIAADRLPGMDGIRTLRALREEYPDLRCILVSDCSDETEREEARRAGITRILEKPFPLAALLALIAEPDGAADAGGLEGVHSGPPLARVTGAEAPLHRRAWTFPRPIGSRLFLGAARG
jgi:CheY-like chemotaxis protein